MSDKEEPETEKVECEETGEVTDTEQYLLPMDIDIITPKAFAEEMRKHNDEARDKL